MARIERRSDLVTVNVQQWGGPRRAPKLHAADDGRAEADRRDDPSCAICLTPSGAAWSRLRRPIRGGYCPRRGCRMIEKQAGDYTADSVLGNLCPARGGAGAAGRGVRRPMGSCASSAMGYGYGWKAGC